jgi:hypothetical protein
VPPPAPGPPGSAGSLSRSPPSSLEPDRPPSPAIERPRTRREQGGFVAVWLDSLGAFRSRFKEERIPVVEEARGRMERYVLDQARAMMARRFDQAGELRAEGLNQP